MLWNGAGAITIYSMLNDNDTVGFKGNGSKGGHGPRLPTNRALSPNHC